MSELCLDSLFRKKRLTVDRCAGYFCESVYVCMCMCVCVIGLAVTFGYAWLCDDRVPVKVESGIQGTSVLGSQRKDLRNEGTNTACLTLGTFWVYCGQRMCFYIYWGLFLNPHLTSSLGSWKDVWGERGGEGVEIEEISNFVRPFYHRCISSFLLLGSWSWCLFEFSKCRNFQSRSCKFPWICVRGAGGVSIAVKFLSLTPSTRSWKASTEANSSRALIYHVEMKVAKISSCGKIIFFGQIGADFEFSRNTHIS